jgi:exonuclease III
MIKLKRSRPLQILGIHAPSGSPCNSQESSAPLLKFLRAQLTSSERLKQSMILMDDFNAVLCPALDRRNTPSLSPEGDIIPLLYGFGLIDCYCSTNPNTKDFTFFMKLRGQRQPSLEFLESTQCGLLMTSPTGSPMCCT